MAIDPIASARKGIMQALEPFFASGEITETITWNPDRDTSSGFSVPNVICSLHMVGALTVWRSLFAQQGLVKFVLRESDLPDDVTHEDLKLNDTITRSDGRNLNVTGINKTLGFVVLVEAEGSG